MVPGAVCFALLGALAVVVACLAWRSRAWPLVHDAPLMHYVAWRIAEGATPYRDVFDMNFPGAYLVHLFVLRVLGPSDAAWRVLDLAWLTATSLAVAAFAASWGVVAAVGAGLFFALHHLASGAWQTGQRDFLLCLPLVLAALGATRWLENRSRANLLWAGVAAGAGITLKPHALLFAAMVTVVVIASARRLAPTVTFIAGVALLPVAIGGWVAARGGLPAWWWIMREYLVPLYARLSEPGWHLHRGGVWIPIGLAALITLVTAATRGRLGARHGIAVLGLVYGLAHFSGQRKGWEYHLYPLAAFASMLLCAELRPLLASRQWRWAVALMTCLVVSLAGLAEKGRESAWAGERGWIAEKERRVGAVVAALEGRLRRGDVVQVLDTTDGGIHALLRLGVTEPTRFIYDFHFFHDIDTPAVRQLRRELMTQLARRPPRFVLLFEHGWPRSGYGRLDEFPELRDYLAASFRAEGGHEGFIIYAKPDDS